MGESKPKHFLPGGDSEFSCPVLILPVCSLLSERYSVLLGQSAMSNTAQYTPGLDVPQDVVMSHATTICHMAPGQVATAGSGMLASTCKRRRRLVSAIQLLKLAFNGLDGLLRGADKETQQLGLPAVQSAD